MIRFQIVERTGADLYHVLLHDMRSHELRTFVATRRGRRVQHVSKPGWMNWSVQHGIIGCEVLSPQKPGSEWQLFGAFLGRLADRYSDRIAAVNVQFPEALTPPARKRRSHRKR